MATRGKRSDGEHIQALYRQIYAVVRRIPRGRVATYGQVAELAGLPRGARVAGAAMRASLPGHRLPWQRVVGKKSRGLARIAILEPVGAGIQQAMLEKEGVTFTAGGSIRLRDFGWLPEDEPRRPRRHRR
jgi:methylated-DNA-protein-cysteine methyltransferase-like protein